MGQVRNQKKSFFGKWLISYFFYSRGFATMNEEYCRTLGVDSYFSTNITNSIYYSDQYKQQDEWTVFLK